MTTDDHPGRPLGESWPTLTEAAERTGHTREALRLRVRRGKLRSVKGNDGMVRLDPRDLSDLPPSDVTTVDQERPGDGREHMTPDDQAMTMVVPRSTMDDLQDELGHTRSALDRVQADHLVDRGRAERAEAQTAAETARADQMQAERDQARTHADQVERERDQARQEREDARVRAASAEGVEKALREALEEARRPAWRRWLGV